MKIALGTKSENKINYLINILDFLEKNNYELTTYNVESGVCEQPLSEQETIIGAKNRAFNAFKCNNVADVAIGMEGGLEFTANGCYYLCVACVYNGKDYFVGISSKLKVPNSIADDIKNNNADLSDELYNYKPKTFNQETLKQMILSRDEMFFESLRNVMLEIF